LSVFGPNKLPISKNGKDFLLIVLDLAGSGGKGIRDSINEVAALAPLGLAIIGAPPDVTAIQAGREAPAKPVAKNSTVIASSSWSGTPAAAQASQPV
jgi:hypothetical protein